MKVKVKIAGVFDGSWCARMLLCMKLGAKLYGCCWWWRQDVADLRDLACFVTWLAYTRLTVTRVALLCSRLVITYLGSTLRS
jgi:hypothetical protein